MQPDDDRGQPIAEPGSGGRGSTPESEGGAIEHGVPRLTDPLEGTAAIQRLVSRARRRIRFQWALEGATTAAILAAATALIVIVLHRFELIDQAAAVWLLIGTAAIVVAGALAKAARRIDDEVVARRIDRASNLSDRLSTAIAFSRATAPADAVHDDTRDLMDAAIRDGVRAVHRANVKRATPFAVPAHLRVALGCLAIAALTLAIPTAHRVPQLRRVVPDHAAVGDEVTIEGDNLTTGLSAPLAALPTRASLGAPNVPAAATAPPAGHGFVPRDAVVTLGAGKAHPAEVIDWHADQIVIRIPDGTPLGATTLTAWIAGDMVGPPLAFTVIDRKDPTYHKAGSVELEPDDRAMIESLVAQLRAAAKRDGVPELEDFAKQVEQLLKDAELGKISKEQLLDAMAKADSKMNKNTEPNQAELDKQLADMGKELAKEQVTKQLGDALQKLDLQKAQQELEKLADQLDKKQLSDKAKEQLAKQLDKVAKQMEQKDQKEAKKQDEQHKKLEDEIRRLQKKKDEAKTDQERLDTERRLDKKKDELQRLEKDQKDKQESAQREAVKRLTRDMQKAAENLQKPDKDQQGQDQEEREQQGSQKLKDAARETGRVDQDRRKQASQKKMASQMEELREAMQRAKQKGNKGPQDPFNRQDKNQDFAQRARGLKGRGQAWKPGQQPGQGQGSKGQGGQGQQPGGKEWGVGHDPNLTGDATDKSGNTKDDELQGKQGKDGGGTRETILAAAQKGFASQHYEKVYGDYRKIIEEVMRTEKLPASYKYYVKRYFAKIRPTTDAAGAADGAPPKSDDKPEDKTP